MHILRRLHLPNQECSPLFQLSNKVWVLVSSGGKLSSKVQVRSCGIRVPKYLRVQSDHLNLNFDCKVARRAGFTPTPIAVDLSKLIFKSASAQYLSNSLSRLENIILM